MISRIACYWGIHTGKYSNTWKFRTWVITPKGQCTITHSVKQDRSCSECNAYEARSTKTGEEVCQPWTADYSKKMAELNEGK
jgi:hypothetical protein